MKKIAIFILLLLAPAFVFGAIDKNLYYGMFADTEVTELQQYLVAKGLLASKATGNFYTLTFNAVKKYQTSKGINSTGYVGTLTRQAINADLTSNPTGPGTAVPIKGSLTLTKNSSYANQSISAPQTNLKLADFSLKNNTTENIMLKKIEVGFAVGSNLYISNLYISNLYATYTDRKTDVLSSISYNNNLAIDYELPVGDTIDLAIFGDASSTIPPGSIIHSNVLVSGVSVVSSAKVYTNSNTAFAGQNITFGSPTLAISLDGSASAKITPVNKRVVAGKFQFKSSNDSYSVSEIKFVLPFKNADLVISGAVLSDTKTGTLLTSNPATVFFDGANYVLDFNNIKVPVALNSTSSVTLSYDLRPTIDSGNTNINIAPMLAYVKAQNTKGVPIDGAAAGYRYINVSYNGITLPVGGVAGYSLYPFKSIPTFVSIPLQNTDISNGSLVDLYKFSVTADANGDISLKQLTFSITIYDPKIKNPRLTYFKFFKENSNYTTSVAIGNVLNNKYLDITANNGVGVGLTNNVVVGFIGEEIVPAGKTQTYTLKAIVNDLIGTTGSISTAVPWDKDISAGSAFVNMMSNISERNYYFGLSESLLDYYPRGYNLLWSDMSSPFPNPHNYFNGSYTKDWYNSNGVLGLPLAAQAIKGK